MRSAVLRMRPAGEPRSAHCAQLIISNGWLVPCILPSGQPWHGEHLPSPYLEHVPAPPPAMGGLSVPTAEEDREAI